MRSQHEHSEKKIKSSLTHTTLLPTAVLIDDDPSSLLIISWLLKRQGYQVVTLQHLPNDFANFFDSLPQSIDIFVIDYCLENCNALEVIEQLNQNKRLKKVAKVVVTSLRDTQIERRALTGGATEFITKPFNKQTFGNRIQLAHRQDLRMSYSPAATIDELTQLPTVEGLLTDRLFLRTIKNKYSVLVVQIVNLEKINTVRGRTIGNLTIKVVAQRLQQLSSSNGIVTRISSSRFAYVLPKLSSSALRKFHLGLANITARPINCNREDVFAVVKFGAATSVQTTNQPENSKNLHRDILEATIANAALALVTAKERNSSGVELYAKIAKHQINRLHMLENAIYSGQVKQKLQIHYQPQINLETNDIVGVEALIRLQTKGLGIVSPLELIPILESTDAIHEIGIHIFEKVFVDLKSLPASITFAINVSACQLQRGDFAKIVMRLARKHKINPRQVEIEITETKALDMLGVAKQNLIDLTSFGFSLALDDFGVGYSNLDYLLALPISKLKIDREFINKLPFDSTSKNIIESLVYLANMENIQLLAEGIETEIQHRELCKIKVLLAQGFYYGKAMPLTLLHKQFLRNTLEQPQLG